MHILYRPTSTLGYQACVYSQTSGRTVADEWRTEVLGWGTTGTKFWYVVWGTNFPLAE